MSASTFGEQMIEFREDVKWKDRFMWWKMHIHFNLKSFILKMRLCYIYNNIYLHIQHLPIQKLQLLFMDIHINAILNCLKNE